MSCPTTLTPYSPESYLVQASEVRIGSTDLVAFIDSIPIDNLASFDFVGAITSGGYFTGLLGPAVGILVGFIVISIMLCTAKIFCAPVCKGDSIVGLFIFLALCGASGVGWFLSIAGNAEVAEGIAGVIDSVDCAFQTANSAFASVDSLETTTDDATLNFNTASGSCNTAIGLGLASGITIPTLPPLNDSIAPLVAEIDNIRATVEQAEAQSTAILNLVSDYLPLYNTIYFIFAFAVIGVIAAFAIFTTIGVLRVLQKEDILQKCSTCGKVLAIVRQGTAMVVFYLGYFLMAIFVIILFLLSFVVILGVDVCVPTPTDSLQDIASIVASKSGLIASNASVCDDPTFGVLCHYQTCTGANPLETNIAPLVGGLAPEVSLFEDVVTQNISDGVDQATDALNATETALALANVEFCDGGVANCTGGCADQGAADTLCVNNDTAGTLLDAAQVCLSDSQLALATVGQIEALVNDTFNTIQCETVTPIYQKLIEQQVCNNLFNGFALTFASLLLAVFALLAAMFVFRLMDLRLWEKVGAGPSAHVANLPPPKF